MSSKKDMIRVQFFKMLAKWFREHFAYKDEDIRHILKDIDIPVLVITGNKDIQANPNDLNALSKLDNNNITVHNTLNMDHLLREFKGEKSILNLKKQHKGDVKNPLSSELIKLIKEWVENNKI